MRLRRLIDHTLFPKFRSKFLFSSTALSTIEKAVRDSEQLHLAELRFAIEGGLPLPFLVKDTPSRERALELFSKLRVWDTEGNCGVLVYLQLADRCVEIVADRGINAKVKANFWQEISDQMTAYFKRKEFEAGSIWAINIITDELVKHFPKSSSNQDQNELHDRPVMV